MLLFSLQQLMSPSPPPLSRSRNYHFTSLGKKRGGRNQNYNKKQEEKKEEKRNRPPAHALFVSSSPLRKPFATSTAPAAAAAGVDRSRRHHHGVLVVLAVKAELAAGQGGLPGLGAAAGLVGRGRGRSGRDGGLEAGDEVVGVNVAVGLLLLFRGGRRHFGSGGCCWVETSLWRWCKWFSCVQGEGRLSSSSGGIVIVGDGGCHCGLGWV